MEFKLELCKQILSTIESKLEFSVEGVEDPQSFDIKCNINISELVTAHSNSNSENDVKYCIALLRLFGYINISNGYINAITIDGFKFITKILHDLNNIL